MKKLIITISILFLFTAAKAQMDDLVLHVAKSLVRLKGEQGRWGDWGSMGDMNQVMDNYIRIDNSNKRIIFTTKFKDEAPTNHIYKISSFKIDDSNSEFGLTLINIEVVKENNERQRWVLALNKTDGVYHKTIITDGKDVQSKYIMYNTD